MRNWFLLWVLFISPIYAQSQVIYHGPIPANTAIEAGVEIDPSLKDLVWHRWTTTNFTVLSLDEGQGAFIANNVEQLKTWAITRWGYQDFRFPSECRLLAVPNVDLMKKLFRIEDSRVEVRKSDKKDPLYIGWLLLDKKPAECLAMPVSQLCFAELGLSYWSQRGMANLNKTIPQIRKDLALLPDNVSSQKLFATGSELEKDPNKTIIDSELSALCLLIRREFGQGKLMQLAQTVDLNTTLSFPSFDQFDKSVNRYNADIKSELLKEQVPTKYLNIERAR